MAAAAQEDGWGALTALDAVERQGASSLTLTRGGKWVKNRTAASASPPLCEEKGACAVGEDSQPKRKGVAIPLGPPHAPYLTDIKDREHALTNPLATSCVNPHSHQVTCCLEMAVDVSAP